MHPLPVEVADAVALASAPVVVSANADGQPATARPPAATVPPVTAMARRRVIEVSLWFPVMAANVGTAPFRDLGRRQGPAVNAEEAQGPSHRHQRCVVP